MFVYDTALFHGYVSLWQSNNHSLSYHIQPDAVIQSYMRHNYASMYITCKDASCKKANSVRYNVV